MSPERRLINLTLLADDRRCDHGPAAVERVMADARLICDRLGFVGVQSYLNTAAEAEIYVVLGGQAEVACGEGETMEITTGDVVYVPAGMLCAFANASQRFDVLRLIFQPNPDAKTDPV